MSKILYNYNFSDGQWSDWSDFGQCDNCCKDGTGGTQNHTRTCDNPAPAHGGLPCEGCGGESAEMFENDHGIHAETESQECNCPVGKVYSFCIYFYLK